MKLTMGKISSGVIRACKIVNTAFWENYMTLQRTASHDSSKIVPTDLLVEYNIHQTEYAVVPTPC
jgi:hypothetical protein